METHKQTRSPPVSLLPRGFLFLVLTALELVVKPLANIVSHYTCCDGQNECKHHLHGDHLLPMKMRGVERHLQNITLPAKFQQKRHCALNAGGSSLPDGFVFSNTTPGGRLLQVFPSRSFLTSEKGECHMTLSELLTLLALGISLLMLIVTVIYDTIDIVLRLKELQTKNEQKK